MVSSSLSKNKKEKTKKEEDEIKKNREKPAVELYWQKYRVIFDFGRGSCKRILMAQVRVC